MKYAVSYTVGNQRHTRYYSALDKQTALAMFEQTCLEGSLTGFSPTNVEVKKVAKSESE
jgi:hypothetical protein